MANTLAMPEQAERGRQRAIARLQRLVKRDAKRKRYDQVNHWLDMIQELETINDIDGSVN